MLVVYASTIVLFCVALLDTCTKMAATVKSPEQNLSSSSPQNSQRKMKSSLVHSGKACCGQMVKKELIGFDECLENKGW